MKVIVFDTETNGLNDCSVLSISAIKLEVEGEKVKEIGKFERYYFPEPGEKYDKEAIKVNGLTEEVLIKNKNANEPKYFKGDKEFIDFCKDTKHYVAHSIAFDKKFLPFEIENEFCTKQIGKKTMVVDEQTKNEYRWPRLSHAAKYYNVPMDESKWHGASYDTKICFKIFKGMLKDPNVKEYMDVFLKNTEVKKNNFVR